MQEENCFICRRSITGSDETDCEKLDDGRTIIAHIECINALAKIIRKTTTQPPISQQQMEGIASLVSGQWVLTRRSFPNQLTPVLLFFGLHSESPKSTQELKHWLGINNLAISNPSMRIKRLIDRDALAVIKSEEGTFRYFITESGSTLLEEYLGEGVT